MNDSKSMRWHSNYSTSIIYDQPADLSSRVISLAVLAFRFEQKQNREIGIQNAYDVKISEPTSIERQILVFEHLGLSSDQSPHWCGAPVLAARNNP
jgi:hypothetical protein